MHRGGKLWSGNRKWYKHGRTDWYRHDTVGCAGDSTMGHGCRYGKRSLVQMSGTHSSKKRCREFSRNWFGNRKEKRGDVARKEI